MKGVKSAVMVICTILLASCSTPNSPKFLGLENVKFNNMSMKYVTFTADAKYNNPNSLGGKLVRTNILLFIDGVEVTTIKHNKEIKVPANDDFSIPVSAEFNPKKILNENDGFLKNAFKKFTNKKLELTYKGAVTIKIAGIEFDVPVDYSEKVSFGLNWE